MKKRLTALAMTLLMLVLLVPAAFAAGTHTIAELDLTSGDHSGKTLEADGYTWDEATHTLTMQDLTIETVLFLPKETCTIVVKGACQLPGGDIARNNGYGSYASDQSNPVTIRGEGQGASLELREIFLAGTVNVEDLELICSKIFNASVGFADSLTLKNSRVTVYDLSWMTDGGIRLTNSTLTVLVNKEFVGRFWAENIQMDERSVVSSAYPLDNYGHTEAADLNLRLHTYIVDPEGGSFAQITLYPGAADRPTTIVDANGSRAESFLLMAPVLDECIVSVSASPAEGGSVSGGGSFPMNTSVTVKASAAEGYHFSVWKEDGQTVSTSASYTFTLTSSRALTAVFEKDTSEPVVPGGDGEQGGQGGGSTSGSGFSSPKTADPFSAGLWTMLAGMAALGMTGIAYVRKRG